jgi:hypothetical protein
MRRDVVESRVASKARSSAAVVLGCALHFTRAVQYGRALLADASENVQGLRQVSKVALGTDACVYVSRVVRVWCASAGHRCNG